VREVKEMADVQILRTGIERKKRCPTVFRRLLVHRSTSMKFILSSAQHKTN
jgi:ABC-type uncharacterized transport system ATPase subunit